MLGPDGVEVLIWSLNRNERFAEYAKPEGSGAVDSKSMEVHIEVSLNYEPFEIRFCARHIVFNDEEGVTVTVTWENGVRMTRFMSKATVQDANWLRIHSFSHWRSEISCWMKHDAMFSCTYARKYCSIPSYSPSGLILVRQGNASIYIGAGQTCVKAGQDSDQLPSRKTSTSGDCTVKVRRRYHASLGHEKCGNYTSYQVCSL